MVATGRAVLGGKGLALASPVTKPTGGWGVRGAWAGGPWRDVSDAITALRSSNGVSRRTTMVSPVAETTPQRDRFCRKA